MGENVSDDIYLIYYNNKFLGMLQDSESFWYLYEWLSDSNGVCNVVTISKSRVTFLDNIENFNEMVSHYGEVELSRSKLEIKMCYDDEL